MKPLALLLPALIAALSWTAPAQADTPIAQLTTRQILEACVAGRAETLPNPYTDVAPDHWAYKAVLTMYYCGAFRQATPRSLIDRLSGDTQSQVPTGNRPPAAN